MADDADVIVIDIGSGFTKVGFAGEDAPRAVFPTLVAEPEETGSMHHRYEPNGMSNEHDAASSSEPGAPTSGALSSSSSGIRVGRAALAAAHQSERDKLEIGAPSWSIREPLLFRGHKASETADMSHQQQTDIECVWHHIFDEVLRVNPQDFAVLVTDRGTGHAATDTKQRDALAQLLFGQFKVPALSCWSPAVLSLFASGRTTGVVIDAGETQTAVVPVFEGFALPHGQQRLPVAGHDLTQFLAKALAASGIDFDAASRLDTLRDIKEKLCAVNVAGPFDARDPHSGQSSQAVASDHRSRGDVYELPDGQVVHLDARARFETCEVLFSPELVLGDALDESLHAGVHQMTQTAIQMCDLDLQRDLYHNIVTAGGTSMLQGFGDRLTAEMHQLSPTSKIEVVADSQRKYAAWIGGSMFASLGTFGMIQITRQDYEDDQAIIHKKHF